MEAKEDCEKCKRVVGFHDVDLVPLPKAIGRADLRHMNRIVVKVGTNVLSSADGGIALGRIGYLIEQLAVLKHQGKKVLLVCCLCVFICANRICAAFTFLLMVSLMRWPGY